MHQHFILDHSWFQPRDYRSVAIFQICLIAIACKRKIQASLVTPFRELQRCITGTTVTKKRLYGQITVLQSHYGTVFGTYYMPKINVICLELMNTLTDMVDQLMYPLKGIETHSILFVSVQINES